MVAKFSCKHSENMIASLLHGGNSIELKNSHFEGEDTFRFAELGARVRDGEWDRRLFWGLW